MNVHGFTQLNAHSYMGDFVLAEVRAGSPAAVHEMRMRLQSIIQRRLHVMQECEWHEQQQPWLLVTAPTAVDQSMSGEQRLLRRLWHNIDDMDVPYAITFSDTGRVMEKGGECVLPPGQYRRIPWPDAVLPSHVL
jgi:hypothetical protein